MPGPAEQGHAADVPSLPFGAGRLLMRYARRNLRLSLTVLGAVVGGALFGVAAQYGLKLLVDGMTKASSSLGADRTRVFPKPRRLSWLAGDREHVLATGWVAGQPRSDPHG